MSLNKTLIYTLFLLFSVSSVVYAGDFDWLENISIEAKADASGFRAKLATRFNIGDVKVKAVISDIGNAADAYMVMRLGEMSGQDINTVVKQYKENRHRGWGVLARNLGIKPGSRAFKALKRGDDMDGFSERGSKHKHEMKEKHGWHNSEQQMKHGNGKGANH
jgi:hypothetical protein